MKAVTTIVASLVFANTAIAADSAVGSSAAGAAVAAAAAAAPAAATQSVTISKIRNREDVRAEAVEAVRNHKTTLAVQLDQYK